MLYQLICDYYSDVTVFFSLFYVFSSLCYYCVLCLSCSEPIASFKFCKLYSAYRCFRPLRRSWCCTLDSFCIDIPKFRRFWFLSHWSIPSSQHFKLTLQNYILCACFWFCECLHFLASWIMLNLNTVSSHNIEFETTWHLPIGQCTGNKLVQFEALV